MKNFFINIWHRYFPKKGIEDLKQDRIYQLMTVIVNTCEDGNMLTPLDQVQIANEFRKKLNQHLKDNKQMHISMSVEHSQKADEIKNALEYLE